MMDKERYAIFCASIEMVSAGQYDAKIGILYVTNNGTLLERDYWNDANAMIPIVEQLMVRNNEKLECKSANKIPLSIKQDFRNFIISKMKAPSTTLYNRC